MKLKLFSVLALCGLIAGGVACGDTESDDDGEGGSGGSGGETSGTTKSTTTSTKASTSATTGGNTTAQTSTTSAGSCDMGTCMECQGCAFEADCSAEAQACGANAECVALNDCYGACPDGDTACFDQCDTDHAAGLDDLNALAACVFCDACFVTCDGASLGC